MYHVDFQTRNTKPEPRFRVTTSPVLASTSNLLKSQTSISHLAQTFSNLLWSIRTPSHILSWFPVQNQTRPVPQSLPSSVEDGSPNTVDPRFASEPLVSRVNKHVCHRSTSQHPHKNGRSKLSTAAGTQSLSYSYTFQLFNTHTK